MNVKIHKIKILPKHFNHVIAGRKKVEVRENDRDYHVYDILRLEEWTEQGGYSGRSAIFCITHILHGREYGLKNGFVALSLERVPYQMAYSILHKEPVLFDA